MARIALALAVAGLFAAAPLAQSPAARGKGLTDVTGLKVGHHTLAERPTGCTVVLIDGEGAVGGVSQRGGAPGRGLLGLRLPFLECHACHCGAGD